MRSAAVVLAVMAAAGPAGGQILGGQSGLLPIAPLVSDVRGVVRDVAQPVRPLVTGVVGQTSSVVGGVTGAVAPVVGAVGGVASGVGPLVGGVVQQTTTLVDGTLSQAAPLVQQTLGGVSGLAGGLTGQTADPAGGVGPGVNGQILASTSAAPAIATAPLGLSGAQGFSQMVVDQLAAEGATAVETVGTDVRRTRVAALIRENPGLLESDGQGWPVLRGEILALSPTERSIELAKAQGFTVKTQSDLAEVGVSLAVLQAPAGQSAPDALNGLRRADPDGRYDFNHIYSDAGEARAGGSVGSVRPLGLAHGRVGLIDGGVDMRHPSLRGARIEQRGFAPGGVAPRAHGLATASLLVGSDGHFRSAAPGAVLYVADVYGSTAAGGSAEDLARALAWMAAQRTPVINISLVGPPNATLQAVVESLVKRGYLIVAAVGNDGPAAPPLYPAAYPGVVAVTAVNGGRRVLPEAGRGTHVDFAAPGADMAAAGTGGYVAVRGTSFAAPLVAGRLSQRLKAPDPKAAKAAVAALAGEAIDLGAPGVDAVYGRGLVGADLFTPPAAMAARGVVRAF